MGRAISTSSHRSDDGSHSHLLRDTFQRVDAAHSVGLEANVRFPPIADISDLEQHCAMKHALFIAFAFISLCGCQRGLPPLVQGATSGSGGTGYDCRTGTEPASDSALAQSPEMTERLRQQFPPGTPTDALRSALLRQGFSVEGPCSPDRSISWAQFRRNGNEVVANVYWREGSDRRLIWSFGEVYYTFL